MFDRDFENMKLLEALSKPASGKRPLTQVNATHPNLRQFVYLVPDRDHWEGCRGVGGIWEHWRKGIHASIGHKYRGIWRPQFCSAHNLLASKESNSHLKTAGRAYVLSDERNTSVWPPSPTPHRLQLLRSEGCPSWARPPGKKLLFLILMGRVLLWFCGLC